MDWHIEVYPTGEGKFSLQVVAPPDRREEAERVARDFDAMIDRTLRIEAFINTLK